MQGALKGSISKLIARLRPAPAIILVVISQQALDTPTGIVYSKHEEP